MTDDNSKDLKTGHGGDLTMMAELRKKGCASANYMCMSGRGGAWIADEKEARGVALRSSAEVAEGVIHVSVRAKASMLRVSARSAIAVYLRGLRRERMLRVHTLKVVEVGPGLG